MMVGNVTYRHGAKSIRYVQIQVLEQIATESDQSKYNDE